MIAISVLCCVEYRAFSRTISRPFELEYNPYIQRVTVLDRPATLERAVHQVEHQLNIIRSAIHKMDQDGATRH